MKAKEWLQRAYHIDREIDMLIAERQAAFDKACGRRAGTDGERVQTSKHNNQEDWSVAYIAYTQLVDDRKAELWRVKGEILDAINQVETNTLRQLLLCRYIRFMKWDDVAEELHYSGVHVIHRLHPAALRAVKDVIECN